MHTLQSWGEEKHLFHILVIIVVRADDEEDQEEKQKHWTSAATDISLGVQPGPGVSAGYRQWIGMDYISWPCWVKINATNSQTWGF